MEPLFINTCLYSKENMRQLSRRLLYHLWIAISVMVILVAAIVLGFVWTSDLWMYGLLMLVIYLWVLFLPRLSANQRMKQFDQLYHRIPEIEIRFYEDHLVGQNLQSNGSNDVAYTQFTKLLRTKNLYLLVLPGNICFLVDRNGFSGATEDEFLQFFAERARNARIDRRIHLLEGRRRSGNKVWRVQTDCGEHLVEYQAKRGFGKAHLTVDGGAVSLPRGLQTEFVGVDIPLRLDEKDAHFVMRSSLLTRPEADLAVDGVFMDSRKTYEPLKKVPWWGWIFVLLCAAAVVLGGVIPVVIGLLGAALSVTVITSGKLRTAAKVVLGFLLVIAVWAAVLGSAQGLSSLLNKSRESVPQVFIKESYSIQLTEAFKAEEDDADYYWEAYSADVGVYVLRESEKELARYGYAGITPGEYLALTNESYNIYADISTLPNGYACASYTLSYDDGDWYYFDVVVQGDGYYWYTEFYCAVENEENYADLFQQWGQTIQIG